MYWLEKENIIRYHYRFHKNKKIFDLNDKSFTFKINFGDSILELEYPKELIRIIKIDYLLGV